MRLSRPCLLVLVCSLVLLSGSAAHAQPSAVSTTVDFSRSDVTLTRAGTYDVVRLAGSVTTVDVGAPELPLSIVTLALPEGTVAVSADAQVLDRSELGTGFVVRPVQPQIPLSRPEMASWVEPDAGIYGSDASYPVAACALLGSGRVSGRPVATVAVFPLQCSPAEGRLWLNETVRITVTVAAELGADRVQTPAFESSDTIAVERLRSMVANPVDVAPAAAGARGTRDGDAEYLIITSSAFASIFQPLADWKAQKGVSAQVLTTTSIYANYSGVDNQERIRNCIIDYYENHGTMWVLLGGDTSVVPARIVFAMTSGAGGGPDEDQLRCDLYYGDLDGTWNADGDGTWGEVTQDEVDMFADIFVGRAPVDNVTEATRFVNKTLTYQAASGVPSPPSDYQRKALFLAEVLWTDPWTDGGICKDMIDDESVPPSFDPITKLYQTNGLLTRTRAIAEMNAGKNIVNHMGHANYNVLSIGGSGLYNSDFDNLSNATRYGVFYSIGCWSAALDYDAIAEHWVHAANAGVAFVGNSRYGWGSPGNPGGGTSDEFDREFFRQLFNNGIDRIGMTHAAHKDAFVGLARVNGYYRYCLYELNLLGDPEMTIWTSEPIEATVNHLAEVPVGAHPFVVTVSRGAEPVPGATVLLSNAEVSETGMTGEDGIVTLEPAPAATGSMTVTVTGQGIRPYGTTVAIVNAPPDLTPPERVDELVAADPYDLGSIVELSWSGYAPPSDFAYYKVYRHTAAFADVSSLVPLVGIISPDGKAWTDTAVENGTPYWYAVTAVDLAGNEDVLVSAGGPVAASVNARILVWDADDGDRPFDGIGDDFTEADGCEVPWVEALDAIGELYVLTETLPADLGPYDLIIYLGGIVTFADPSANSRLTDAEADALSAFLDAGGDIYVEEPNFGGAYVTNGTPATVALWGRFHASFAVGAGHTIGNVSSLAGSAGTPSQGQSFAYDYLDWPDQFVAEVGPNGDPGTARLWSDQSAKARGCRYVDAANGSQRYMVPVLLGGMTDGAYPSTRLEHVTRILSDLDLIGTSGVDEGEPRLVSSLRQNAPNPFNPVTTISYSVAQDGARVRLAVYDVSGRLVAVLADGPATAGEHAASWDGRSRDGEEVSSGVYFCRLAVDGWTASRKMTLLK